MEKVLADSAELTPAVLMQSEDLYHSIANSVASRSSSSNFLEAVSKNTLDSLNPTADTIPYLFIVAAAIRNATSTGKSSLSQVPPSLLPNGELWPYLTNILLGFDVIQVRYAGQPLLEIIDIIIAAAEQTHYPPVVQLLGSVILRLDPSSSTLTSTHHAYVRLCLLMGMFEHALEITEKPIYHFATSDKYFEQRPVSFRCSATASDEWLTESSGFTEKLTSRIILEFYSMCASCYIGLGRYRQAIVFLEVLLVAPTANGATSVISIDGYKKWILLHLIIDGQVPDYPSAGFQATARNVRSLAKPYECVLDAFKQQDPSRLLAEIHEGQQVWQDDQTLGLISEVHEAHRIYAVRRLGKIFAALPVPQVAALLPTDSNGIPTLAYLQNLITTGDLRATITTTSDGSDMLRFLPDAAGQLSEDEVEQKLSARAAMLKTTLDHIGQLDHRMHVSKEYVEHLKKLKKSRDEENKKTGNSTTPSWTKPAPADTSNVDEDMMGEY